MHFFGAVSFASIGFMLVAALCAGFVDAIAGGGGLIQLPALLIGLPQSSVVQVLGTNKLSSFFGTTAAAIMYRRRVKPDLRFTIADGFTRVCWLHVRSAACRAYSNSCVTTYLSSYC